MQVVGLLVICLVWDPSWYAEIFRSIYIGGAEERPQEILSEWWTHKRICIYILKVPYPKPLWQWHLAQWLTYRMGEKSLLTIHLTECLSFLFSSLVNRGNSLLEMDCCAWGQLFKFFVMKTVPTDISIKLHPHLRLGEHCERGYRKTLRTQ